VTALRRKGADLDRVQLDVALNPELGRADSGRKGKVIGVAVAVLRGATGINQAIPVSHLAGS